MCYFDNFPNKFARTFRAHIVQCFKRFTSSFGVQILINYSYVWYKVRLRPVLIFNREKIRKKTGIWNWLGNAALYRLNVLLKMKFMTGEPTFWYDRPVKYFVIIFYHNFHWKRRIYRKNKYHINMRLITICDWVDCCACSSAYFFAGASGALFFSSCSLISFTNRSTRNLLNMYTIRILFQMFT